jgi:AsmA protein
MKKSLKIGLIVLSVLLVIFIGITLLVKSYLTDAKIRTLVTETAEKSLHRKVIVGDIKISLFRGIVVRDLEVKERDSEEAFIRTKDFILKYQLLPLLSKKLIITELSLNRPEVHLRKNPDSSFNFSDISGPAGASKEKEPKPAAAGLPVTLDVKTIKIRDARLDYSDPSGKLKKADVIVNAELGIAGLSSEVLSSEGGFELRIAEALLKGREQALKDIKADFKYKVEVDMVSKKITVHSFDADIMNIPVSVQGTVSYATETAFSLDLKMPGLELAKITDIASQYFPAVGHLGGTLSLMLKLSKEPIRGSPLGFSGGIGMSKVSFTYKGLRPVLDGSLKLSPEIITFEGFKLLAGQNGAAVSGSVRNYREYPDINIAVRSRSLDLDELFVIPPPSEKKKKGEQTGSGVRKEPEPMNLKLRANVSLDIDKTRYKGISIINFRSAYLLKDNIFRITNLSGNTLSGSFAVRAIVDLAQKGTRYSMNADLNGIKLEDAVNAFAPKARDTLFGTLYGKTDISGAGTLPEAVKQNLKGKGDFSIKNGFIRNARVSTGLLAFLGLQELKQIPMDKAEGNFTISNGVMNLTSLIASKDLILDEKGTIGMNEELDIGVLVKLSDRLAPKLVSQSISQFLSEEKGWTSLPLRIRGTISKPSYAVDTQAVGKKATEKLQKKIGEELFKTLQKGKDKPDGTKQKKEPTSGDLIRGLFGN